MAYDQNKTAAYGSPTTIPELNIQMLLNKQAEMLEVLNKQLADLRGRLSPVIKQSPNAVIKPPEPERTPELSHVGMLIYENNSAIDCIRIVIADIYSTLNL